MKILISVSIREFDYLKKHGQGWLYRLQQPLTVPYVTQIFVHCRRFDPPVAAELTPGEVLCDNPVRIWDHCRDASTLTLAQFRHFSGRSAQVCALQALNFKAYSETITEETLLQLHPGLQTDSSLQKRISLTGRRRDAHDNSFFDHELAERVVHLADQGLGNTEIGRLCGIAPITVSFMLLWREAPEFVRKLARDRRFYSAESFALFTETYNTYVVRRSLGFAGLQIGQFLKENKRITTGTIQRFNLQLQKALMESYEQELSGAKQQAEEKD